MKISIENQSKMLLKDHSYTGFVMGVVLFLIGTGLTLFFMQTIKIGFNANILPFAFGAIFALVGIYVFVTARMTTVILDKVTNRGDISIWSIIKRESREFEFANVKELVLQESIRSTTNRNSGSTQYSYDLNFVLKDGGEIIVYFGSVSGGLMTLLTSPNEQKKKEAQQVADFIGVSMRFIGAPSFTEVLSVMKDTIAKATGQNKPPQ